MTLGAAAIAAAAVLPAAVGAHAAAGVTVQEMFSFTTAFPGSPSGRNFTMSVTGDPGSKPPALTREVFHLPAGARFTPSAIPQCDDTDQSVRAVLMVEGRQACPAGSYLGLDRARLDTGGGVMDVDVDEINAKGAGGDELLLLASDHQSGLHTDVFSGSVTAGALDIQLPLVPGGPPDFQASDVGESMQLPPSGTYLTTPSTCPASRQWVSSTTYTFKDGTSAVVDAASPCTPAAQQVTAPSASPSPAGGIGGAPPSPPAHHEGAPGGGSSHGNLVTAASVTNLPNTARGGDASAAASLLAAAALLVRRRRRRRTRAVSQSQTSCSAELGVAALRGR